MAGLGVCQRCQCDLEDADWVEFAHYIQHEYEPNEPAWKAWLSEPQPELCKSCGTGDPL